MSAGKKIIIVAAVIAVLGISLYSLFAGNYNKFVQMDVAIKAAWAQVENQLQRRYDLIPNLVETVKGYAKQEKDVLVEVTNARSKVGGAGTVPDKIAAARRWVPVLVGIMAGTFAVIEIATEWFIASMAHRISPWLGRVGRRFNQACGGVFIAVGAALPLRG